jgi:DHA1 family tetracycline resistance protein-like MFS transporter
MTAPSRAAVGFVLVTVALDVLAIGIVVPVQPKLVEMFLGGDTARAAIVFGAMSASWALMQLLFSPLLGALSDRFGRRPVILLSNLGLGLDYVLMALAPSVEWLFVGRIVSGICAASFSTAAAYIADVTPAEKRAAAFGLIGAAFGIGFVLGPAVGGLLGASDPRLPFWVAAAFSLANTLYGFLVLPESLPQEHRAPFKLARANPVGSLHLLASDRILLGLAATMFLSHLAHAVLPAIAVLYMGHRYGWGVREVGFVLAAVGAGAAVVQGGLIRPAVVTFGPHAALVSGLLLGSAGLAVYGLATSPLGFCLGIPLAALWGLAGPAAQQLMTARVGVDAQGRLQGAGASLMAVANLIGPVLFTQVFAASVGGGPGYSGLAFVLAAGLLVLAALTAASSSRYASGV